MSKDWSWSCGVCGKGEKYQAGGRPAWVLCKRADCAFAGADEDGYPVPLPGSDAERNHVALELARTTVLEPIAAAWMLGRAIDTLHVTPAEAERLVRAFVDAAVAGGAVVSFEDLLRFGCEVRDGGLPTA